MVSTTNCKWDSVIPLNDYIVIKEKRKSKIFYKEDFLLWYYQQEEADYKDAITFFEENKLTGLWTHYKRIIKNNGAIILFGQEPFSTDLRNSNIEMYRYDWIWRKQKPSNFQLMNYQPGRVHENIMVFSNANACYVKNNNTMHYYPQMVDRDKARKSNVKIYGDTSKNILHDYKNGQKDNYKEYTKKHPISIIKCNTEDKKLHPTQKPINLLEYIIKTYTKENNVVLDSCMGSGSTGVACKNMDRNFIGIEIEKEYYDISVKRIVENTK